MNVYSLSKEELAIRGRDLALEFLNVNDLNPPEYMIRSMRHLIGGKPKGSYGCGFYFPNSHRIIVSADDCSLPSPGLPRRWSFPGYITDRTPMGVMAHETGHAVDKLMGYPSNHGFSCKAIRGERLTSYEPNSSEKFAETMRLFILNPGLLHQVAPQRYAFVRRELGIKPLFKIGDPLKVLKSRGATGKILDAAIKKASQA